MKTTQKEIKRLINDGIAVDVSKESSRAAIPESYEVIGYSRGIYGVNGIIMAGDKTGKLYAVLGRGTGLFIFLK